MALQDESEGGRVRSGVLVGAPSAQAEKGTLKVPHVLGLRCASATTPLGQVLWLLWGPLLGFHSAAALAGHFSDRSHGSRKVSIVFPFTALKLVESSLLCLSGLWFS